MLRWSGAQRLVVVLLENVCISRDPCPSRCCSDADFEAMSGSRGRSFSLRSEETIRSITVPSAERVLLSGGDKPQLASLYQVWQHVTGVRTRLS